MPWCPVCKNEYNVGVKACADCGAELVASLEERKEILLISGEETLVVRMQRFLEYNDIPVIFESEDGNARLYVLPKHERKAKRAVHVFLSESAAEAENAVQAEETAAAEREDKESFDGRTAKDESPADTDGLPEDGESDPYTAEGEEPDPQWGGKAGDRDDLRVSGGVYRKKSERADDLKSSGEVLLVFGILGSIAILLIDFGILPIRFGNRIMMNVIMLALFFFFIGFGIYSLKGARRFRAEASDEDALTERIDAWAKEHLTAENIDEAAKLEESDADEICFFKRTEAIRKKIADEFAGVDESYLDSLTENVYQELFE